MSWFTKKEAGEYLRCSARTIKRYTKCTVATLPHAFIGNQMRFHKSDLDAWMWFKKPYHKLTKPQKEVIKERNSYGR